MLAKSPTCRSRVKLFVLSSFPDMTDRAFVFEAMKAEAIVLQTVKQIEPAKRGRPVAGRHLIHDGHKLRRKRHGQFGHRLAALDHQPACCPMKIRRHFGHPVAASTCPLPVFLQIRRTLSASRRTGGGLSSSSGNRASSRCNSKHHSASHRCLTTARGCASHFAPKRKGESQDVG